MNSEHETNLKWWEEVTPLHYSSRFYDVPAFIGGRDTLGEIELEALGDVTGKALLHLQCHFGLDTLSWARRGAAATGVDFSTSSIAKAKDLARHTGLESQSSFVCCDVLELDRHVHQEFDIVFTSHGVLEWLSDLDAWGRMIRGAMKPGGAFFLLEVHPFSLVFDELSTQDLRVANSYFAADHLIKTFNRSDYTDRSFIPTQPRWKRLWRLDDVFRALEQAGLQTYEFHEYPFSTYRHFPDMQMAENNRWYLPPDRPQVPLMFSLKARRT